METQRNAYDAAFKLKAKAKVTLRATTKEAEKVCDEVILRLFNSDTEDDNDDDYSGFSAQEEDEDSNQLLFW